jgi:hypothetical protein
MELHPMTDLPRETAESRSLEAAREAAWQAYKERTEANLPMSRDIYMAGAEWGIAAVRERIEALVEAVSKAWHPDTCLAYWEDKGACSCGYEAIWEATRALESLGVAK